MDLEQVVESNYTEGQTTAARSSVYSVCVIQMKPSSDSDNERPSLDIMICTCRLLQK